MWISELSERSGLPVDTIKHYLRVGVLPRGEAVGPLRAEYDESHVHRLQLVKAMHDVGRLSLEQIRQVFASIDTSQDSLRAAVAESHMLLSAELASYREPSPESVHNVDTLIERMGWDIGPDSTHRRALAVAIDVLRGVRDGTEMPSDDDASDLLDLYARHAENVATRELAFVDISDRTTMLNSVVTGSVLFEPLVLVIRRLAQEHTSRSWWAEQNWSKLQAEEA